MAESELRPLFWVLMGALDDLDDYAFSRFKLYLEDSTLLREFGVVKRNKLNNDNRTRILTAMMDTYGIFTINVMKTVLRAVDQNLAAEELERYPYNPTEIIKTCTHDLKSEMRGRFKFLSELVSGASEKMEFHDGYTELFITEGGSGQVNEEHEVRQMERHSRKSVEERTVQCQDIFTGLSLKGQSINMVLTKGVAGVGKTVLTQKFILDWAEDRANQNIQLLFPFTFRELNLLQESEFSLMSLLHHFFSLNKDLSSLQHIQVLFIFDGLDECRFPLNFNRTRILDEPTECVSMEVLLVNLIRGKLLPSARIWITTRPAAAGQIPDNCISMATEVRGFTDAQKELYFRKRFRDEEATTVISHIKKSRSLFIMCHIPVFCWILMTVLHHLMKTRATVKLPQTLTQMYAHFLVVQAKIKNTKYEGAEDTDDPWTPETKKMVRSLGRLAFKQLQKGNLIFYDTDLRACELYAADVARYSGVFTQVFREEPGQGKNKVYCFIHLSVQEFLTAFHVHESFFSSGYNLLLEQQPSKSSVTYYRSTEDRALQNPNPKRFKSAFHSESAASLTHSDSDSDEESEPTAEEAFYYSAVDQALQNKNGHLDLFLRFLLGLSVSTNQRLLRGLLTQARSDWTNQRTVHYIKNKLNMKDVSPERSLNLLHCLNELKDHSLLEEIQRVMKEGHLSSRAMSPADWSVASFLLLSSDSDLEQFDLTKYCPSQDALLGLLPVVKASTRAILSGCGLTDLCCGPLASVLCSSSLTQLDLSNNDLQDSGVKLLCEGMVKNAPCRLETLRLSGCLITERGGASLAAALSSAPSRLTELDLSYNHPGSSAELLNALRAPAGTLQSLRLDPAGERWLVPGLRKYACEFTLDPNTAHRDLHLSEDGLSVTAQKEQLQYPDHQDRFTYWWQVLSSTGLRGRCYWEVDWRLEWEGVDVAMTYRGISRQGGRECAFGYNNQSWNLGIWRGGGCTVRHNRRETRLPATVGVASEEEGGSGRVGVYLDWEGGALSFYDVNADGGQTHIHTFNSSFTEDLFPGLRLYDGSSAAVVDLTKPGLNPD